jgi:hypothetical protein
MKTKFNEYINENSKIAFDEEIIDELKKLYIDSFKYSKYKYSDFSDFIDERIKDLLKIHKSYLEIAKNKYSANHIAKVLFKSDKDVVNRLK